MKKVLFTLIIMVAFLYMSPVFAETDVSVCDSGCDYTSLDQVLGAMDAGTLNDDLNITVDTWNEQKIGNHTLTHIVGVGFTKNAAIINGEGSTLTIPKGADFWVSGNNLEIKDLKVNYTGGFGSYDNGFLEDVLYFDVNSVNMTNVTITGTGTVKCNDYPTALFNDAANLSMQNVKIENFPVAITHGIGNISISSSTLNNNYTSIISEGNVAIDNSSVKNVFSTKAVSVKNVGDLKAFFYTEDEMNNMTDEAYCTLCGKKGIHQRKTNEMSISMERSMDINMKQTSSIDNLLAIFRDDTTGINDFEFTTSDDKIATVKNNTVTMLKSGQVTITAANNTTRESYVLNLKITNPINSNPVTSPNTFFTIGIVLILLGGITMFRNMRSEQ